MPLTPCIKSSRRLRVPAIWAAAPGVGMVVTVPNLPAAAGLETLQPLFTGLITEAFDLNLKLSDVVTGLRTAISVYRPERPVVPGAKPFSSGVWVSSQSRLPAFAQIIQAVRRNILVGELKAGEAFPSVRQLSQQYQFGASTVQKAVAALKISGHLACQPGIGMVVTDPYRAARSARLKPVGRAVKSGRAEYWKAHKSMLESVVIKLLSRCFGNGFHPAQKNEFPQVDCLVFAHLNNTFKVVEFGHRATSPWRRGGFIFVKDATERAIKTIRKSVDGMKRLNRNWFEFEACHLVD